MAEMDCSRCGDLDPSFDGNQLRFLCLLLPSQIGARSFSGEVELPRGGFRFGESVRVVVWDRFRLLPSLRRSFCCGGYGICWLWCSVACHHQHHHFALFSGVSLLLVGWIKYMLVQHSLFHPLHSSFPEQSCSCFIFNAVMTSFHLLLSSSSTSSARLNLLGAIVLLVFPLCAPLLVYARDYFLPVINHRLTHESSGYVMLNIDELKSQKASVSGYELVGTAKEGNIVRLGDEHSFRLLISRLEFWLYYIAYFCGGTIGLVYSNNLGQIAQSLGQNSTTLVTIYSSFSFFGRLLSAAPDFMHKRYRLTRTGWFAIALLPTPIAFFLLAVSSSQQTALQTATALIGLSSGFIFAAAVSITSDLFGPNSVGVNHNILITNIPIGSLLYGYIAASIYEANASPEITLFVSDSIVCLGRDCYFKTFMFWGFLSILGVVSSLLLYIRTKPVYNRLEQDQGSITPSSHKDLDPL
ncbi:PREDICTED: protein NUCLEAR FUSION DEFECTIVE 4-like isoform X2 [Camelina sativa]|uniref:Protein NUCLEAR FUSION DEFECTIVE 4-like isoform X2 n=1 Tax=Camelina sativa TaxID=90675 RepID=A0ABM0YEE4_CAMSA|nr:PREDICTED: protein NUCLEAR FUSION DEFECTIVE 4-like isoform X2 [Camelina sativa]